MPSFVQRMRTATLVAMVVLLFATGVVAGAAGQALILGQANSAGFSNTSLTTNTNGTGFQVTQQGTGTALRGVAGIGIAGFFTSANGSGVSGVVANDDNYGVYAANDAGSTGSGAALRANGKSNTAVNASSTGKPPVAITGPTNQAPMTVNSEVVVTNLNADETDGWDVGCPAGTTWAGGLCLETAVRTAASVYVAADTCVALGSSLFGRGQQWMLPSPLQLRGAHNNNDIDLTTGGEWSDSLYVDDTNGFEAIVAHPFGDATLLLNDDAAASHVYRCGAIPLSFDPITIILPLGSPENDQPAVGPAEGVDTGPVNADGTPAD